MASSPPSASARLRTLSLFSSFMLAGRSWESSPRGPFTFTTAPSIFASTLSGRGIGFLPTLLMGLLPARAQPSAASRLVFRLPVGQQPFRRRKDVHSEPRADAGHVLVAAIDAQPGFRDALQ